MKNVKEKLQEINQNSSSLSILREINRSITERNFHEHTHILYDLRTFLGESKKNYVEIGSYVGASASLILKHYFKTNVTCIDPCVLQKSHYKGTDSQYNTIYKNLQKNNPHNMEIKIFKNFSHDILPVENIDNIDILHIDGDHSYNAVIKDYNLYKDKVNTGGFIVFDDYHDYKSSPEVKPAVDKIVSEIESKKYEVIGSLNKFHNIKSQNSSVYSNFIIQKIS